MTNITLEKVVEGLIKEKFPNDKIGHLKKLWTSAEMELKDKTLQEYAMLVCSTYYENVDNIPADWRAVKTVQIGFASLKQACDTAIFAKALDKDTLGRLQWAAGAMHNMIKLPGKEHKFLYARDPQYKDKFDRGDDSDEEEEEVASKSVTHKVAVTVNKTELYAKMLGILLQYVESKDDPLAKVVVDLVKMHL